MLHGVFAAWLRRSDWPHRCWPYARPISALAILALLAGAGPAKVPSRSDMVLALIPAQGDTLRVIATLLHGPSLAGSPDSSVDVIRIVDRRGETVYSDSMLTSVTADGVLEEEVSVDAERISFEGRTGLTLYQCGLPAIEGACGQCRHFVLRGQRLVPVTPWSNVCELTAAEVWTMHFTVRVPVRIRFDRAEGGVDLRPTRDPTTGLAVLDHDQMGTPDRYYGADTTFRVRLFRGSEGDAVDSVTVTPSSRVVIGRVYGEVGWWESALPGKQGAVTLEIKRLQVTVNGRRGFVEEGDFEGLGLITRS